MLTAFVEHMDPNEGPHLLLAGPDVVAVADDPEGQEVFTEVEAAWSELLRRMRRRVHLALLPTRRSGTEQPSVCTTDIGDETA